MSTSMLRPNWDRAALETAWEVVYGRGKRLASIPLSSEAKFRIFIAYHSADRWIAECLHSALVRCVTTFLDVRCVRPGDRWVDRVRAAQDGAELSVVLVGASGGTSWFQQAEYLRAIELAQTNRQRLVPLYINGAPGRIPYGLEGVQGIVKMWRGSVPELMFAGPLRRLQVFSQNCRKCRYPTRPPRLIDIQLFLQPR